MLGTQSNNAQGEPGKPNQGQQQESKKFLSKKERVAKKEEERRARQQQERESTLLGNALYAGVNEFNYKNLVSKRHTLSVERTIEDLAALDDKKKKKNGLTSSPSMSKLIMSGSLANKFVDMLIAPGSTSIMDSIPSMAKSKLNKQAYVDWRAQCKPLKMSEDSKEHIELAKGK